MILRDSDLSPVLHGDIYEKIIKSKTKVYNKRSNKHRKSNFFLFFYAIS